MSVRSIRLFAVFAVLGLSTLGARPAEAQKPRKPTITKRTYGKLDKQVVDVYTLTNTNGVVLKAITYGAIVTELHLPDRNGKRADVVLGYDKLADYVKGDAHFGGLVGRVANRIKGAQFTLNGATHKLAANNGPDHLHGGPVGWDRKVWQATSAMTPDGPSVMMTLTSPDGDEGYPGTVTAKVTYVLTNDNQFRIDMEATSDKPTLVNLAHHGYWNLGGQKAGPVLDHEMILEARKYTPGAPLIPDGKVAPVAGTPFDFTTSKPIGKDLKAIGNDPIGYDVNYVVDGTPDELRVVARVKEPKSGRVMLVEADQPGVQFYTSNYLNGSTRGKGMVHVQHSGFCLETQKFPNAINVPAWKDQAVLQPGKVYKHRMIHRFTTE
ncbi:MAG TPA: aldose epimerase family protein [Polyangia bacterium]